MGPSLPECERCVWRGWWGPVIVGRMPDGQTQIFSGSHTLLFSSTSQCLSTPELLVLKSIPKDLHVSRQNLHAQWALRRGPSLILLLLEGLNVGTIGTRFHSSPVHGICLLVSREKTTVTAESSSKTGPLPQPLFQASAHSLLVSVLPV